MTGMEDSVSAEPTQQSFFARFTGLASYRFVLLLFVALAFAACASRQRSGEQPGTIGLPSYTEFAAASEQKIAKNVVEIYGRYTATISGKTGKAGFNLLLDPGKSAYMEILNPSSQLTNAVSFDGGKVSVLWAGDGTYIEEEETAQTLNAIAGLPVMPDDLLYLIAGYGLNFSEWRQDSAGKDGWVISRAPYIAKLTLKEHLSRIVMRSADHPTVEIDYDEYRNVDNQSLPARIRFRVPSRKLSLEMTIDKFEPRDEPGSPDLFALKLPDNARRIFLRDIYHGKPVLLQQ